MTSERGSLAKESLSLLNIKPQVELPKIEKLNKKYIIDLNKFNMPMFKRRQTNPVQPKYQYPGHSEMFKEPQKVKLPASKRQS